MTIIKNLSWSCYALETQTPSSTGDQHATDEGEVQSREDRAQTHTDAFPQSCRKVQLRKNVTLVFFLLVFKDTMRDVLKVSRYKNRFVKSHLWGPSIVSGGGWNYMHVNQRIRGILVCCFPHSTHKLPEAFFGPETWGRWNSENIKYQEVLSEMC